MPQASPSNVGIGHHSNPERYRQDNNWGQREVEVAVAGVPGEQNLGGVVGVGLTRRIRTLIVRFAGTDNTVLTLLVSGGATVVSWDIAPQSTRVLGVEDGFEFVAGEQPAIQTSDITGGSTFISAVGIEA